MATTTKKQLTNKIADRLKEKQMLVRDIVQEFLDACIDELAKGNRLEFRDFGVFETVQRAARKARNPKTGEVVHVPPKTVVDFKMGKRMRIRVNRGIEEEEDETPESPEPQPHTARPAEPPRPQESELPGPQSPPPPPPPTTPGQE
ncbi:MAG: HU family DNA-binding protein [Planctomycetota bacterium]